MLVNWIVVTFSLLWTSSLACNRNENCVLDESDETVMGLLASMDHFTTKLIQRFIYDPDANVVISPMSNYVILALVLFGCVGNTQKELIKALQFPNGELPRIRKSLGDIIIMTDRKRSKNVEGLEYIAVEGAVRPGIFFQQDFTFVDEYATYLSELNIITNPLDFINDLEGAATEINRWIQEGQPKSKLPLMEFIINKGIQLYFTSFFYFTAKWKENLFLDVPPGPVPFHTLQNGVIDVQMMKTVSSLLYYDCPDTFTAVEVPFEGEDFSAIFIVPHEKVDAVKFATTFTVEMIEDFLINGELVDVDCQIPVFSYEYALELNTQLQEWGIKLLFGEADLSNMFNMDVQKFGVQVSHASAITINELGASPDAILKIQPVEKTLPTTNLTPFIANRPFLMLIRSTHSYAIVFATFFHLV